MNNQSESTQSGEQSTRTFNPKEHLIQLKSRDGAKDYLPVQWRLVWFREQCPEGAIDTEEVLVDLDREVEEESYAWNAQTRRSEKVVKHARGYARFRAIVTDGKGGRATGTKSENAASFADYIEKAETGAIGRALAALGYGTQFAPEIDEAHRIVDAPVESRTSISANGNGNGVVRNSTGSNGNARENGRRDTNGSLAAVHPGSESEPAGRATEQQIASIRKLCEHLNKSLPENLAELSNIDARKTIQQLTTEYREQRQQSRAS